MSSEHKQCSSAWGLEIGGLGGLEVTSFSGSRAHCRPGGPFECESCFETRNALLLPLSCILHPTSEHFSYCLASFQEQHLRGVSTSSPQPLTEYGTRNVTQAGC